MSEEGHSNDSINESDESQEGSNVEQCWKRNDQSEQKFPDSFRGFDQTKDSADSEMDRNLKSVASFPGISIFEEFNFYMFNKNQKS